MENILPSFFSICIHTYVYNAYKYVDTRTHMYISLDCIVFEGLILKVAVVVAELTFIL